MREMFFHRDEDAFLGILIYFLKCYVIKGMIIN
jgi:hypothetical protein